MADDLPNLGTLIKCLKMTTSSHDGEALIAIRKANEQLQKFGGDWETLLRGKVTVIGDPFAAVPEPEGRAAHFTSAAPTVPKRPQAPLDAAFTAAMNNGFAPRPFSKAPQAPSAMPPSKKGWQPNKFAGTCYCCGIFVNITDGFIFKPTGKFEVVCINCNDPSVSVPPRKARMQKPNLNSLGF